MEYSLIYMNMPHGRACPTQSHRRRAPVFYVPADAPHRAHDILDDVRAGERTPQFRRQSELCYGEHLVEPFQDRGGNALPVLFEMPGKVAKKRLGLAGIVQLPGLPQHAPHLCVHDVACFMYLDSVEWPRRVRNRLGESLRAAALPRIVRSGNLSLESSGEQQAGHP